MVGFRTTQEVFTVYQPEKILISSGRGSVPRLCGIFKRHPYGRQKNRGC